MSMRLQVILDDEEMREIQQIARRERMTVAEWVRRALREVRSSRPGVEKEKKIEAIRAAARHSFPTADIEILHRYAAISRLDAVQPAFDAALGVVDEVYPIEREDAAAAKGVLLGTPRLSARAALHVAVMRRRGLEAILSFDAGFDSCAGIRRIG